MSELPRSVAPDPGGLARLWIMAAGVAGLGAWVLYDALPGINWVLWTGAAVAGLLLFLAPHGRIPRAVPLLAALALAVAGAAARTASPPLWVLITGTIVFLLSIQMLLAAGLSARSITAWFAGLAPLMALRHAVIQSARRSAEATQLIRSTQARAWVRGIAITLPVVLGFSLLLAGADPVFAGWRDAIERLMGGWEFVARIGFFLFLMVIVLGAYGYAAGSQPTSPPGEARVTVRWLGSTERLILLGGVAALLWLFLALQLGYLFGNLPRLPASGVTFAEYARRGFAELTVVASATALIIVGSERFGNDEGRGRTLRLLTLAVIAAVLLLLGSAFRRVWLYESAYGFTTARLYAQVYMVAVAAGLAMLSLEVAGGGSFDPGRLFRRAAGAALILFIGLLYWNHEAWIARQNLDRFARTGKLDVTYLARELSLDALPAIAERLPGLPDSIRSELSNAVVNRFAGSEEIRPTRWFEWNRSRERAREALARSFTAPQQ